ncbi:MAG: glycosyltransferase [Candidatus Aenigmarchaeota archaeon]|nr:glycosyltransferase [Candidatus Aenigmarchaeota archaeon]
MKIAKRFGSFDFPKYDAYIFSGVWCISAASNCHPNALYLHTPMRILYDLRRHFLEKTNPVERFLIRRFIKHWLPKDQAYMRNFDVICANSENVRRRVMRYYGKNLLRKTIVVYTGIETKRYKFIREGDFYLSAARLDPLKRIDMIIAAFMKMPNRKLVIAGNGPDEQRLKRLAAGCKNITFLGSVNDKKLLKLYGTCKATIAANVDEDLGLIAIESHASGKPIAAIKEGGFLETVNSGNGVFFSSQDDIPRAIEKLERTKWDHKKIRKSAEQFDTAVFSGKIKKIIEEARADY